jgi:hypothetical protein
MSAGYSVQQTEVEELGRQGEAFKNPDGRYSLPPCADRQDCLNAIRSIGRSSLRPLPSGRSRRQTIEESDGTSWRTDFESLCRAADPEQGG